MERTLKVSAGEVKLGGMTPDTPKLALHLLVSLFNIIHDFYHCDLMTSSKISAHATEWGPAKVLQSGSALAKAGPARHIHDNFVSCFDDQLNCAGDSIQDFTTKISEANSIMLFQNRALLSIKN